MYIIYDAFLSNLKNFLEITIKIFVKLIKKMKNINLKLILHPKKWSMKKKFKKQITLVNNFFAPF